MHITPSSCVQTPRSPPFSSGYFVLVVQRQVAGNSTFISEKDKDTEKLVVAGALAADGRRRRER